MMRKRPLLAARYYVGIYVQKLRKTTKTHRVVGAKDKTRTDYDSNELTFQLIR